ncbi:dTDP-4-dehydrorhamnose 3,5-epimerase [bioreactor metagenome]|uniref:dTDP-4-dehydrorhamnose 3,5-epimerase n=1 Tax=bioreactor metagenome TaxID=1076179 RepID=A0A644Z2M0_9ZZZZ
MKKIATLLAGVFVLEPDVYGDVRGYFMECWSREKYAALGLDAVFVQDNESFSRHGVLRGLHYQLPPWSQSKLVRAITGTVLDVVVDIRRGSPTFGRHVAIELSGETKRQVFVPRGMAHGFSILSETALFGYKCDNRYVPESERGIAFDDPALGIDWQLPPHEIILAEKDKHHPRLADAELGDGPEAGQSL